MFIVKDLKHIDYFSAYKVQKETVLSVIAGENDVLILCEHDAVLTLGRIATEKNFLFTKEDIEKKGVTIARIDRGGEVTFHGPGQLVAYPIFNLNHQGRDLRVFLSKLEQVAIDFLKDFDIVAHRQEGQRGVWAGKDKIASIGVGVKKWVSFHGLAININTDLSYFSLIRPCGLDVLMTSVASIKGKPVDFEKAKERLVYHFEQVFSAHFAESRTS